MARRLRREDLGFLDRAPLLIEERTTVDATPEELWPALADAEAWVAWFPGMVEARYTSPAPHGAGSTRFVSVKGLRVNEEILAFDEGRRFGFTVLDCNRPGIAAMAELVTLEPDGGRTLVTYRQAIEFSGPAKLLVPVVKGQLAGAVRAGLAGLGPWVTARRVAA